MFAIDEGGKGDAPDLQPAQGLLDRWVKTERPIDGKADDGAINALKALVLTRQGTREDLERLLAAAAPIVDDRCLQLVVQILASTKSREVRWACARHLANASRCLEDEYLEMRASLDSATRAAEPPLRRAAIIALARTGYVRAVGAMAPLLNDQDQEVRRAAAAGICHLLHWPGAGPAVNGAEVEQWIARTRKHVASVLAAMGQASAASGSSPPIFGVRGQRWEPRRTQIGDHTERVMSDTFLVASALVRADACGGRACRRDRHAGGGRQRHRGAEWSR